MVILQRQVQYDIYFTSFSYLKVNGITGKYEKRVKYLQILQEAIIRNIVHINMNRM